MSFLTHPPFPSLPRRSRFARTPAGAKRLPLAGIEQADAILRALDSFLYLTNDQIEILLFAQGLTATGKPRAPKGAAYAANTALRRLFDGGYLDRVPVFLPAARREAVKAHYVNVLSPLGARTIAATLRDAGRTPRWRRALLPRSWQPILHGSWIRQFAVTGRATVQAQGWRWWSWFDDRQLAALKKERGAHFTSVPDGFFIVTNPATGRDQAQFVEIDLGTETVRARSPHRLDWRMKMEGYLRYLEDHYRDEFGLETLPVVLTVTESDRRLDHLLAATAEVGGGGRFWFTTIDALLSDTSPNAFERPGGSFLAPVWHVPTSSQLRSLANRWGP